MLHDVESGISANAFGIGDTKRRFWFSAEVVGADRRNLRPVTDLDGEALKTERDCRSIGLRFR